MNKANPLRYVLSACFYVTFCTALPEHIIVVIVVSAQNLYHLSAVAVLSNWFATRFNTLMPKIQLFTSGIYTNAMNRQRPLHSRKLLWFAREFTAPIPYGITFSPCLREVRYSATLLNVNLPLPFVHVHSLTLPQPLRYANHTFILISFFVYGLSLFVSAYLHSYNLLDGPIELNLIML